MKMPTIEEIANSKKIAFQTRLQEISGYEYNEAGMREKLGAYDFFARITEQYANHRQFLAVQAQQIEDRATRNVDRFFSDLATTANADNMVFDQLDRPLYPFARHKQTVGDESVLEPFHKIDCNPPMPFEQTGYRIPFSLDSLFEADNALRGMIPKIFYAAELLGLGRIEILFTVKYVDNKPHFTNKEHKTLQEGLGLTYDVNTRGMYWNYLYNFQMFFVPDAQKLVALAAQKSILLCNFSCRVDQIPINPEIRAAAQLMGDIGKKLFELGGPRGHERAAAPHWFLMWIGIKVSVFNGIQYFRHAQTRTIALNLAPIQQALQLAVQQELQAIKRSITVIPNLIEAFKLAVSTSDYDGVKRCLEQGLAVNTLIQFNQENITLFEYAAIRQPGETGFAALVLYFDRMSAGGFITAEMIRATGHRMGGAREFTDRLQQSYHVAMGSYGPLAPISAPDRLLDVTYALTVAHEKPAIKTQFKHFYEALYNRNDFKILLKLAALATHGVHQQAKQPGAITLWEKQFKVFADPNSIYTHNMYLSGDQRIQYALGLQTKNHVFLGIKTRVPGEVPATLAVLIHEITHFIAREIYNNNALPYKTGDVLAQGRIARIYNVIATQIPNQSELSELFTEIGTYPAAQHHSELIARVAEYLINEPNPQTAKAALRQFSPDLHDFYFDVFLKDCATHYRKLMGGYIERQTVEQIILASRLTRLAESIAAQQNQEQMDPNNEARTDCLEIERQLLTTENQRIEQQIAEQREEYKEIIADDRDPDYLCLLNKEALMQMVVGLRDENKALMRQLQQNLKPLKFAAVVPRATADIGLNSEMIERLLRFDGEWKMTRNDLEFSITFTPAEGTDVRSPLSELHSIIRANINVELNPREELQTNLEFEENRLLVRCVNSIQADHYEQMLSTLQTGAIAAVPRCIMS